MNENQHDLTCDQAEELIVLRLYGELEDLDEQERLESHLMHCESCPKTVKSYQKIIDLERQQAPEEIDLPEIEPIVKSSPLPFVAAALLLLSFGTLLYVMFPQNSQNSSSPESHSTIVTQTTPSPMDSLDFDPFSPITLSTKSKYKSLSSLNKNSLDRFERRLESLQTLSLFEGK